jgi:3-dehydroquinate synthetase
MLKMACIKDAQLFHLLEQHAEQLRATSFQVPDI